MTTYPDGSDGPPADPAVSRHRVGRRLRQLRQAREPSAGRRSRQLGIAGSTRSRIETSKATARASYLLALLDLYHVTDPLQRQQYTEADPSEPPGPSHGKEAIR